MKRLTALLLTACMTFLCVACMPNRTFASDVPETPSPAPTEAPTAEPTAEPTAAALYINFDEMCFYINGVKFTLGVSTLQDMIDAGVPFRESDLENAGNNLRANYQSEGFRIVLGEYLTAIVYMLNDSDSGMPVSECCVCEIYIGCANRQQDILHFDFPLDLTMEELIDRAGEPSELLHFDSDNGYDLDTLLYQKASAKYFSCTKYSFEFVKGVLTYVTMTCLP